MITKKLVHRSQARVLNNVHYLGLQLPTCCLATLKAAALVTCLGSSMCLAATLHGGGSWSMLSLES